MRTRRGKGNALSTAGLRFLVASLHCEVVRQRLQIAWVITCGVLFSSGLARAQSTTNDPAALVRDTVACMQHLHEIFDQAAKLEENTATDQVALVDCIHSRVLKIKGLFEMTEAAQPVMQKAFKGEDTDAVAEYAGNAKMSCARAEKLLLEAQGCSTSPALKILLLKPASPLSTSISTNTSTNVTVTASIKITPRMAEASVPIHPVERTRQTCLRQQDFAVMLARAMVLKLDEKATPDDCVKALAKLAVEPLNGWQPGKCTTVDDVYVGCARAMNLKVKDPQDPLSYAQALREEGIGVDTLLPERDPQLDPPLVVDSEVRALLSTGYAAPLPSARRVAPD
jgi:hypothetical protein